MKAQWQKEKDAIRGSPISRSGSRRPAGRPSAPSAKPTCSAPPSCATGRSPSSRSSSPSTSRDADAPRATVFLKEEVDADDVAEVVASWTGIPVSRLMEGETEKLVHMEDRLHERVVGQDEAIEAVATALRRSRAGLSGPGQADRHLPLPRPDRRRQDRAGAGSGGVPLRLPGRDVRIDMSEYMEKHSVARLLGAPPGYVGYEEGGQLTEAVAAAPIRWCCWTRSRRPTRTCSTPSCRSWTTVA